LNSWFKETEMLKAVSTANGLVSPTFSGNVTLSNGNLIIGTAGKGIDFSADPAAPGMTSELLDDYEEGTWTPTQGGGLTVVGGFTSSGTYTKVGNLVYVSGIVQGGTSVVYAGGTSILAAGLPFTINGGFGGGGGNAVDSALAAGCGLNGNRGTDTIYGDAAIASTLRIFFSLTYVV
jgi:hypothetical protein